MFLEVSKNGTISSLDLLKEINFWRAKESENSEKERAELQHKDLLKIIRNEFEEEIREGIISPSQYDHTMPTGGIKKLPKFDLVLDDAKQVLLRESVFVRRSVIKYITKLEDIIKEKNSTEWLQSRQNGKLTRRRETDSIQTHLIPLAIEQGSKNYKMFYANYSTLVNKAIGLEKGMRDKCTRETLLYIEFLESLIENTIVEEVEKNTYYKDIYQVCKQKIELIKQVKNAPRQKYLEDMSLAD